MAANLDAALQPGETIVFRTRGRAYGRTATAFAAFFFIVPVYSAGKYVIFPTPGIDVLDIVLIVGAVTLAFGALIALILALVMRRQHRDPDDLIITDRRVLFTKSEWSRKIETAKLDRIDRIAWSRTWSGGLILEVSVGGRVLDLPRLRGSDALAKALTDATGAPPLPALGRMTIAEFLLPSAVMVWAVSYPTLWLCLELAGFPPGEDPTSLGFRVVDSLVTLGALGLAWLASATVGSILAATFMRPFVTPEQMQAGLCAGQRDAPWLRIALRWAGLLYGRTLPFKPL